MFYMFYSFSFINYISRLWFSFKTLGYQPLLKFNTNVWIIIHHITCLCHFLCPVYDLNPTKLVYHLSITLTLPSSPHLYPVYHSSTQVAVSLPQVWLSAQWSAVMQAVMCVVPATLRVMAQVKHHGLLLLVSLSITFIKYWLSDDGIFNYIMPMFEWIVRWLSYVPFTNKL